jgi:hypothetical protein
MTIYQLALLILLGTGLYYSQLRYAKANYPNTRQWKCVLFVSSLLFGFCAVFLFGYQGLTLGRLLTIATVFGLFTGLGFTFVFPLRMQAYYPKRKELEDSDQEQ